MDFDAVTKLLTALIAASGKSHATIAEEVGYAHANNIAMLKMGLMRVPLKRVGPLAKALNADPAHMLRLVLETYSPETLEAITDCVGHLISRRELEILKVLRRYSKNTDPPLLAGQEEELARLFAA